MYFYCNLGIDDKDSHKLKTNLREAVRAVAFRNGKLLMVRLNSGDLKFPGGGIKSGEKHIEALAREVKEETGYALEKVDGKIGEIIERRIDNYEEDAIFQATSHYYICQLSEGQREQELEAQEAELDFQPEWISLERAIAVNERNMAEKGPKANRWVLRETVALRYLQDIFAKHANISPKDQQEKGFIYLAGGASKKKQPSKRSASRKKSQDG